MEITIKDKTPDIRHLNDMPEVIYDKEWLKTAQNSELYYMYRGLEFKDDLRYDITTVPSKMLGQEFVKTKGHEHIGKYGEVYIVLEGQAIYLLQKRNHDNIEDVYAVEAKKGDVIIIPPFYGHVTINPSSQELKMANWISKDCKSDYNPYLERQGACYFYTKNGWIKNTNYSEVPELRFEQPIRKLPEDLSFLKG